MRRRWMLVAGAVAAVVVATLVVTLVRSNGDGDSDTVTVPPVVKGDIVADGVLLPVRSIDLSFPVAGTVTEVAVLEGEAVEEGQLLLRLDDARHLAAVTQAEAALAKARARLAQLEAVSDDANLARAEEDVAGVRVAVFLAEEALKAVRERPSHEEVVAATARLRNAQTELNSGLAARDLAQGDWDDRVAQAIEARGDAAREYRRIFQRFLGMGLTDEQLLLAPTSLLGEAGVDLVAVFDRSAQPGHYGQSLASAILGVPATPGDDPATPWSEEVVFMWLSFFPGELMVSCENGGVSPGEACILKEMEDAWKPLNAATLALNAVEANRATALASAENVVAGAHEEVDLAHEALDEVLEGPDASEIELSEKRLEAVRKRLSEIQGGTTLLPLTLSEQELVIARADVSAAEAALEQSRLSLQDTALRAPFAGTVALVETAAAVGGRVQAGARLMRLADFSEWVVETRDLDERSVVRVRPGVEASVTVDAIDDLELAATVVRVTRYGERLQGNIIYKATVSPGPDDGWDDPRLRWQMSVVVTIVAPADGEVG